MTIKRNYDYKSFNDFLKVFLHIIKDKKIKAFISTGALWCFENNEFTDKIYTTDEYIINPVTDETRPDRESYFK